MNIIIAFSKINFFLSFAFAQKIPSELKSFSDLAEAVNRIADETYLHYCDTISLVFPDNSSYNHFDFKDNFLSKSSSGLKAVNLESLSHLKSLTGRHRKRLTILPIVNYREFQESFKFFSTKIFHFNGFFVFVLVGGSIPEVDKIFGTLWNIQIYNILVVFEDENSVRVLTFWPFNTGNCNDMTPVLVNEFRDGKFVNNQTSLFRRKMRNLHNCPIRVSVITDTEPYIFLEKFPNGSVSFKGGDVSLVKALSEALNFKIVFNNTSDLGKFYDHATMTGNLAPVAKGDADLSIANWWLAASRLTHFSSTTSYKSEAVILMVPPGREYSAWSKLVYPFSKTVWAWILLVFVVGYLAIYFITQSSTKVKVFVFGADVEHPYLNMIVAFVGGTQKILPTTNFARFLLMMFLMYALVIRTVYNASYFRLLQSSLRHPEIQSIDEIISNDYKFYIYTANEDVFNGSEAVKKR